MLDQIFCESPELLRSVPGPLHSATSRTKPSHFRGDRGALRGNSESFLSIGLRKDENRCGVHGGRERCRAAGGACAAGWRGIQCSPGFRVAAEGARGAPTVHRLRPFAIPSRVGTRRLEADLVGKGYRPVVWINGPFADKLKFGSTCKSQGFVDLPQVVNLRLLHRDEPRRLNRADRLEPRYRKS